MKTLLYPNAIRACALLCAASGAASLAAQELASTPFAARSEPEGQTLFTELSSQRTGISITNEYDDPRMWADLHREYHVGSIGTGVTVGDYDADGKPDVYIVSKIESGRLYRNLGDWRFEDVTEQAGLLDDSRAWKQGAAFVDVDNDGRLDLYVCRFGVPNQLFINQGDGAFKDEAAARGLAVVDASSMASFADYDRDGWLDVYIQTNLKDASASPEGQRDYLFRNLGNGRFRDVTDTAGILKQPTQGHSATWWDHDEDGWLDLYVANDFDAPDFLYRNNGDGTFSNVIDQALPHTTFSSMGSDSGDVDNDGRIDFFVADMSGATREQEQRGQSSSRARADARRNENVDTTVQIEYNALYLNTGAGRSFEAARLAGIAATDWTWTTRFEDLDHDGRLDLFVTNGMDREQNNVDLIVKKLSASSSRDRIRIAKTSPLLRQANLAYANRGDLRFEEVGGQWGLDQVGVSFGAAFGDFDGDGDLDLVFGNYQQAPTVLRNDGQSGSSVTIALRGTGSNRFGIGARVEATTRSGTQVRELGSARGYLSTSEPIVHFGFGDEQIIEQLRIVWPSGRVQTFRDLATGQRYIVTEPEQGASKLASKPARPPAQFEDVSAAMGLDVLQREESLEGTVSQPLLPRRFNRRGPGIAVGNIGGGDANHIVFGATATDGAKLLRREGSRYRALNIGPLGKAPAINDGPPLIFDANGDGANDLLFAAGGAALPAEEPEYASRLWLNDGRGGFGAKPSGDLPFAPISVGAAVAADFDRDGKLDLFLGARLFPGLYPEPPNSALLIQRDGRLKDATREFAPGLRKVGLVTSGLATDVDGDGWIDLVVALEWGGIRFFRNEEGGALADVSKDWGFDSAGSGLWTSLAAADFNRDGQLDYALGNLGLNTIYAASPEHPLRLFVADFASSGEPQLVLAFNDGGKLAPVASRAELGAKIPATLKRVPSNNAYAAASLEDILGEEALAAATVYEASELRSGVLLSQPSGKYVFAPLPRYAQIAPVQGLAAADFDGDGASDLLIVGNDYSPIPSLGRWDGGLGWLLRGDGAGGFETVPVAESGWIVPGNAKALAIVDLDGDARPDAIVSRNDQSALAFRNALSQGDLRVALRLRGRGGNPDAIGARVALESDGQTSQLFEVHAGGGYASQSTPTLFFAIPAGLVDAKFRIRWPSGAVAEVAVPAQSGYLDVSE